MTEGENGHVWHDRVFSSMKIKCCMNCGFIKNEDQMNKPCPGPIGVGLRERQESTMTDIPVPEDVRKLTDKLANEIRRVDGNHSLGAGALAEALLPFIAAILADREKRGEPVKAANKAEAILLAAKAIRVSEAERENNVVNKPETEWDRSDCDYALVNLLDFSITDFDQALSIVRRKRKPLYASAPPAPAQPVDADARKLLARIEHWASTRCPCHEETPNPCPLCGASVENLEACKAVEETFPRDILRDIRSLKGGA